MERFLQNKSFMDGFQAMSPIQGPEQQQGERTQAKIKYNEEKKKKHSFRVHTGVIWTLTVSSTKEELSFTHEAC